MTGHFAVVKVNGEEGEDRAWSVTLPTNRDWPVLWAPTKESAEQLAETINAAHAQAMAEAVKAAFKNAADIALEHSCFACSNNGRCGNTISADIRRLAEEG